MARWRRDTGGPEWPERLTRFCEWEWSEAEILEAAEAYTARHARANNLAEPLPPDRWPRLLTAGYAFTHFRLKWAMENDREQELVDEMIANRLERGRRGSVHLEDET
jgi:hypothetical protein